jgi:hypothetical protein
MRVSVQLNAERVREFAGTLCREMHVQAIGLLLKRNLRVSA